jgi:flagellar hook-length control protein FliK
MMSAKTLTPESPVATAAVAPPNTAAPGAPGAAPSEFQNLLTAAAPTAAIELQLMDTLPTQPPSQTIGQLPGAKPQPVRPGAVSAQPASAGAAATKPATAGDLLKLLSETTGLLPESGDTVCMAPDEAPDDAAEELLDAQVDGGDDDILTDWLDAMVPYGIFAAQAGSDQAGEAPEKRPGGHEAKGAAISASLLPQALVPDPEGVATIAAAAAGPNNANTGRDAVAVVAATAAQNVVAAVIAPKQETLAEQDKPSNDWMTAMGDLATKRGHEAVPAASARISTPVHDSRWADAIAHRLVMMAREGESVAQLKLVPQDLGPLDIQITVRDSEANVHFGASNAETRAVLESSLPRLRELLSAQGLQLANASVSQHSAGHSRPERNVGVSGVGAVADDGEAVETKVVSTALLDIYA